MAYKIKILPNTTPRIEVSRTGNRISVHPKGTLFAFPTDVYRDVQIEILESPNTLSDIYIGNQAISDILANAVGAGVPTNHDQLLFLGADDHTQYHNDARGDARYYTKTLLDGGQLDTRYVRLTTNQTIAGIKTFSNNLLTTASFGIGTTPGFKFHMLGNHDYTQFLMHASTGGDSSTDADLFMWASEPDESYTGVGIANNRYNTTDFPRLSDSRGGSYMRLLDEQIWFGNISNAGVETFPLKLAGANAIFGGSVGIGTATPRKLADFLSASQSQLRLTYQDNVKFADFTVDTNGDLTIGASGNDVMIPHADTICSNDWTSRSVGWGIYHMQDGRSGGADFRYLSVDEMHAKRFVADLEQALAGSQIISKSVAILALDVLIPEATELMNSVSIFVEDLPGTTANVFADGDWVQLRVFNRAESGFLIANAWGTVVFSAHVSASGDNPGIQEYIFTRDLDCPGAATGGELVAKGSIVLDFGVDGDGFIETTTIDAAGSPYQRIMTRGDKAWDQTLRTQVGALDGIAGIGDEWGLFAGDITAKQYLLASDQHFELHGIDISLYDGATNTVKLDHTGLSFAMGATLPSGYMVGDGIWMGKDTDWKMRVGSVLTGALVQGFSWDGTDFTVKGGITATTGAIGGWVIGANDIKDVAGAVGLSSSVTGGDDIRFWAGHATPASAPFSVTKGGVLKAASGTIGGWGLDTDAIYTGDKSTVDGYNEESGGGITLAADGSIHAPNFYLDADGTVGINNATVQSGANGSGWSVRINESGISEPNTASDGSGINVNMHGYNGSTTYYRDFLLYDGKTGLMMRSVGSTNKITFSAIAEFDGEIIADSRLLIKHTLEFEDRYIDTNGGADSNITPSDCSIIWNYTTGNGTIYLTNDPYFGQVLIIFNMTTNRTLTIDGQDHDICIGGSTAGTASLPYQRSVMLKYMLSANKWVSIAAAG
jgi:hypothetical protein